MLVATVWLTLLAGFAAAFLANPSLDCTTRLGRYSLDVVPTQTTTFTLTSTYGSPRRTSIPSDCDYPAGLSTSSPSSSANQASKLLLYIRLVDAFFGSSTQYSALLERDDGDNKSSKQLQPIAVICTRTIIYVPTDAQGGPALQKGSVPEDAIKHINQQLCAASPPGRPSQNVDPILELK